MTSYRYQSYLCSQAKDVARLALDAGLYVAAPAWGLGYLLIQYNTDGDQQLKKAVDYPCPLAVICFDSDTPIGIAIFHFDLRPQLMVYVRPDYRGKGVASGCVQTLLNESPDTVLTCFHVGVGGVGSPQMWHKLLQPYLKQNQTVLDRIPIDAHASNDLDTIKGTRRFQVLDPNDPKWSESVVKKEVSELGLTLLTKTTRLTLDAFIKAVTLTRKYPYVAYDQVGNLYTRTTDRWDLLTLTHPWMKKHDPYLQFSKSNNKKKLTLWLGTEFYYWEHMRSKINVKTKDLIGLYARVLAKSRIKIKASSKPQGLFDSGAQVLVNPVNTQGVMGAGLALQFKKRFPKSYRTYRRRCHAGELSPGGVLLTQDDDQMIAHLATKGGYSRPSKLSYVAKGLVKLGEILREHDVHSVAIPALGCGLGGLPWGDVKATITQAAATWPKTLTYVYPPSANTPCIVINQ